MLHPSKRDKRENYSLIGVTGAGVMVKSGHITADESKQTVVIYSFHILITHS